jgi:hypothetical protein
MIGSISYGTFKNHIYIHIRKYIYTSVFDTLIYWKHIELLTWMIKWYTRQHWIESHPSYITTKTYDFRRRETTSSHLFSLKSIYEKSYHWRQYFSYTKMHITKVSFFISLQIWKFTSWNPIYQNSNHIVNIYHIPKCINTKVNISEFIYPKVNISKFIYVHQVWVHLSDLKESPMHGTHWLSLVHVYHGKEKIF